jgi:hypothetical protein
MIMGGTNLASGNISGVGQPPQPPSLVTADVGQNVHPFPGNKMSVSSSSSHHKGSNGGRHNNPNTVPKSYQYQSNP